MITRTDDRSRWSNVGQRHDGVHHGRSQPHSGHPRSLQLVDDVGCIERAMDDGRGASGNEGGRREIERADVIRWPAGQPDI